jgi:hypothetical protein
LVYNENMLILVGKKRIRTGTVYMTTDGYFTGLIKVSEELPCDIPTAVLCMYMSPELPRVSMFKKAEWIKLVDLDCQQILTWLAHSTNIRYEDKKIEIARNFVLNMPYFERETIDMRTTSFETFYRRFKLHECLSEGTPPD